VDVSNAQAAAAQIAAEIRRLPSPDTASVRQVRQRWSRALRQAEPGVVMALAAELIGAHGLRWVAYELVRFHKAAFAGLTPASLETLGQGMAGWDQVDAFARTLSGPAWLAGLAPDELFQRWARSPGVWWRRAALVSTVALNMRSQGGPGDVPRTLAVCALLVDDHHDMIAKAMSWALRELVPHDPQALLAFMRQHDAVLAARVKREVNNKLKTGLKNVKRAAGP
jgi:3-methyladenine DNA glycosylase AlkD